MPQNIKLKNSETGEILVMPWNKSTPPNKREIEDFKKRRDAELVKPPPDIGVLNKVGSFLYNPLESFPRVREALSIPQKEIFKAPSEKSQAEVEKLPLLGRMRSQGRDILSNEPYPAVQETRVGRKTQQVLHDIASPENIALTGLTAGAGALPKAIAKGIQVGVPAYFAEQMAEATPEAVRRAYEHPSFENVADVGLTAGGAALATVGAMHGVRGEPKITPKVEPPKVAPKQIEGMQQKLLPENNVIDAEFVVEPPSAPQGKLDTEVIDQGMRQLPRRGEQPIRGQDFTMGAPKVIIPTVERPVELGPPLRPESRTSELAYSGPGEESRLVEKPTGFVAGGKAPVNGEITVAPPTALEEAINAKARELEAPAPEALAVPEVKTVEPEVPKVEAPKTALPKIENEWLRQQETEALQIMRKGQKGPLANEIDTVLSERGIQPPKAINAPLYSKEGLKPGEKGEGAPSSLEMKLEQSLRMQRPREAGVFAPFKKAANSETPEGAARDFSDLDKVLYQGFAAPDAAIEHFGRSSPAAAEISRLLKFQRTEGNRLSGVYDAALHEGGLQQQRQSKLPNITDEEFGNYRVQDAEGNVHVIIPRGVGGSNETKYVTRTPDGVKPKEGYTLLGPLPGNLVDVMLHNAMPANPAIAKAAAVAKKVRLELYDRAFKAGFKPKDIGVDLNAARDRATYFDEIRDLAYRVATAETVGREKASSPKMKALLDQVEKAGGDRELVKAYVDRILSKQPVSPFIEAESGVYNTASKIMTAKYLPLFSISNLATIHNLAVRGSIKRLIPALVSNLRVQDRMRSQIVRTGALSRYLTDDLAPESLFGKLYGIRGSEQYLRAAAADIGRGTAVDLLEFLKKKEPGSFGYKAAYSRLKNLTLKTDAQMAELIKRGKLNEKEMGFAGGRMSEMTQGLTDAVDLPYAWTGKMGGPLLDYVFTYKRFAYASTKILIDSIKENPQKAIPMLLSTGAITGEILGSAKSALRGALASTVTDEETADAIIREIENRGKYLERVSPFFKDYPNAARYVDDLLNSWSFGLISDLLMAATEGPTGISEFITGPFIALVGEIATSIKDTANDLYRGVKEGDWQNLEDWLTNYKNLTPGNLGPAIKRSSNAPKK